MLLRRLLRREIRTVDDVRRKGGEEDRRELPRMGTLILEAVGGACGR